MGVHVPEQVKIPSSREHDLTWKPYGYYKKKKAMTARRRCIALMSAQMRRFVFDVPLLEADIFPPEKWLETWRGGLASMSVLLFAR